jgi:hypothetical protein
MAIRNQYIYNCVIMFLFLLVVLWMLVTHKAQDAFTPKINQAYRPYYRGARIHYDTFMNYFTKDNIILKLKKWNVY